jgi:hypothetical protein
MQFGDDIAAAGTARWKREVQDSADEPANSPFHNPDHDAACRSPTLAAQA